MIPHTQLALARRRGGGRASRCSVSGSSGCPRFRTPPGRAPSHLLHLRVSSWQFSISACPMAATTVLRPCHSKRSSFSRRPWKARAAPGPAALGAVGAARRPKALSEQGESRCGEASGGLGTLQRSLVALHFCSRAVVDAPLYVLRPRAGGARSASQVAERSLFVAEAAPQIT